MKNKTNTKLELTDVERKLLRSHKIRKADILDYAPDELEVLLNISNNRANELYALADFQRIPSIGIEFAKDLIFLGYYNVNSLQGKKGAELTDQYEKEKGFMTDPCVEDQFRLAVNFAHHENYSLSWWDFTKERKEFRSEFGYPSDRPTVKWIEIEASER